MNRGYVKFWRCSQDNPMYFAESFTRWQAWQDLILLANHRKRVVSVRGNQVEVGRGQVAAGEEFLAKRWTWSRGKVRRFLKWLEIEDQVVQQKNRIISIYTVVNYKLYQGNDTTDGTTESGQTVQQTVQQNVSVSGSTPDSNKTGGTTDGTGVRKTKAQKRYTPKNVLPKNNISCAKPHSDLAPEEIFLTFPTTGSPKEWHLTKTKLAEYESTFDTLDVNAQCRLALQWIKDNPSRRKTARGMPRFLNNWLSRAVNNPRAPKQGYQQAEAYTGAVL